MNITLNGQPRALPDGATAGQIIEVLGLAGRRLAMEVNGELVPRSRFDGHALHEGDRVEVVHAIGGG